MKPYKMLNGDIDKLIEQPSEEEEAYLDRYFPKGDKRRGDALVIYAYMKSKQIRLIKLIKQQDEILLKGGKKRDESHNQP